MFFEQSPLTIKKVQMVMILACSVLPVIDLGQTYVNVVMIHFDIL
jgi:hypothetical protein